MSDMSKSYNAPAEFVQFALSLADAAGEIVRLHFNTAFSVEYKSDASPVTAADHEVEAAMRALIEKTYPNHGIFGEELGRRNEGASLQWVLDPIDGTRSFIAGYPMFTTLIALVKDNVPVVGVIEQSILRERWVGAAGKQTTLNGKPVNVRNNPALEKAVMATTSTYYFSGEQAKAFEKLRQCCAYTLLEGDAYGYAQLANGRIDLMADARLKPYDFCALVPVIEGAGGVITDWSGAPVTLTSKGDVLAAANHEVHKAALTLLRQ